MKKLLNIIIALIITSPALFAAEASAPSPTVTPNPTVENLKWVNDKLQSALADTLNKATTVAGDAKDFIAGQLPDVIKQLLVWKFFESLAPIIFFAIISLILINQIVRTMKNNDFRNDN